MQDQLDAAFAEALGHFRADRLPAAETIGRQILALQPRLAETLHLMGAIALKGKRVEEGIGLIERAIALNDRAATYHNSLGEAYRLRGDTSRALACYERALAIDPTFAHAQGNLTQVLGTGDAAAALAYYRRQVAARPQDAAARANLAGAILRSGDIEGALATYKDALHLDPTLFGAHCNMGLALADLGRIDEAIACYLTALGLQPNNADAHNNLGLALLLTGSYATAWPHHEYRPQTWMGRFKTPPWKGEELGGQRILLHAEQGIGDTLQFARYAPLVAARGGKVVLEVQPALQRLMTGMAGTEAVITAETQPPGIAWHCPLMSLPLAFGTTLETIPGAVPYIAPPADLAEAWRARLDDGDGDGDDRLKVGLVWQGQPLHRRDRDRSLPPAALAPLGRVKGARFFSLQKSLPGASGFADLPPGLEATDLAADFGDYADTAAAVAALDLVIAVDTSVAHLAGALGKPVWLLLHRVADWRWLQEGQDSLWYPTARLFRQSKAGAWEDVVAEVGRALARLIRAGRG